MRSAQNVDLCGSVLSLAGQPQRARARAASLHGKAYVVSLPPVSWESVFTVLTNRCVVLTMLKILM